jgi:hypothetical protein
MSEIPRDRLHVLPESDVGFGVDVGDSVTVEDVTALRCSSRGKRVSILHFLDRPKPWEPFRLGTSRRNRLHPAHAANAVRRRCSASGRPRGRAAVAQGWVAQLVGTNEFRRAEPGDRVSIATPSRVLLRAELVRETSGRQLDVVIGENVALRNVAAKPTAINEAFGKVPTVAHLTASRYVMNMPCSSSVSPALRSRFATAHTSTTGPSSGGAGLSPRRTTRAIEFGASKCGTWYRIQNGYRGPRPSCTARGGGAAWGRSCSGTASQRSPARIAGLILLNCGRQFVGSGIRRSHASFRNAQWADD